MLRKYPRTRHIEGSRLQPGDHDLASVPFAAIAGRYLVVEEKLDGANAGISFTPDGDLRLQSRGHYLTGGPRERQFGPFKAWAASVQHVLRERLRDRYVLYGEWLYAKHTVFYDALPTTSASSTSSTWRTGRSCRPRGAGSCWRGRRWCRSPSCTRAPCRTWPR